METTIPGRLAEETYPKFIWTSRGMRVQLSQGAYLPGVFRTYLDAERAFALHEGKKANVKSRAKRK